MHQCCQEFWPFNFELMSYACHVCIMVLVLFEFCVGGVGFVTSFVYVIHYATTCSYFVSSHLRSPAVSWTRRSRIVNRWLSSCKTQCKKCLWRWLVQPATRRDQMLVEEQNGQGLSGVRWDQVLVEEMNAESVGIEVPPLKTGLK